MKRIIALLLACLLVTALFIPAAAEEERGQVFRLLPSDIVEAKIVNGTTGKTIYLEDRESIEKVVSCLTSFRYQNSVVELEDRDGYEYLLVLEYPEGFFVDGKIIRQHCFTDESIQIDKTWYYGAAGSFSELADIVAGEPDVLFDDVTSNDSYYNAVKLTVENGIFLGASDTKFLPNDALTRGMAATILHRFAGLPKAEKSAGFKDVSSDDYYAEAVDWAVENGIIQGTTETAFSPNRKVTREQFAVMLYRYVKAEIGANSPGDVETWFSDAGEISPYAREAVEFSLLAGLMDYKNREKKIMAPKDEVTRADAAEMMRSLTEYMDLADDIVH